MGWLYRKSLNGYATPKAYLDTQFTFQNDTHTCKVLRSVMKGKSTYYAAVERTNNETGVREVSAYICLVEYNPRAHDGYFFGYKDLHEAMGPYESNCPETILDLLTPTTSETAIQWRQHCRASAAKHRAEAFGTRPSL